METKYLQHPYGPESYEATVVWKENFKSSCEIFTNFIKENNGQRIRIHVDTEFPGFPVATSHRLERNGNVLYRNMAANINVTEIIQLGLTVIIGESIKVFQFNFYFDTK